MPVLSLDALSIFTLNQLLKTTRPPLPCCGTIIHQLYIWLLLTCGSILSSGPTVIIINYFTTLDMTMIAPTNLLTGFSLRNTFRLMTTMIVNCITGYGIKNYIYIKIYEVSKFGELLFYYPVQVLEYQWYWDVVQYNASSSFWHWTKNLELLGLLTFASKFQVLVV